MRILNSISSQKKKVSRDVFYNISDREQAFLCLYETQAGFCNTDFFISINGRGQGQVWNSYQPPHEKSNRLTAEIQWIPGDGSFRQCFPAVHHTYFVLFKVVLLLY